MLKTITCSLAALLVAAGVAVAGSNSAKTYNATLKPLTGPTGATGPTGPTGKAHLVDGKKNNPLSVHVKGLTAGTTYPWHVHKFADGVTDPCAQGATQGPIDTRFTYSALKAGDDGNASAKGRSKTFAWGTDSYYVNVHDPVSGAPISCGVLKRQKHSKSHTNHGKHKGQAHHS